MALFPALLKLAVGLAVAFLVDLQLASASRAALRGVQLQAATFRKSQLSGTEASAYRARMQGLQHRARSLAEAAAVASRRTGSPRPSPSAKPARRPPPSPLPPSPSPPVSPPPSGSFEGKSSNAAGTDMPSQVCGTITLVSPRDKSGALTYTFGKQVSCDGTAAWMAQNLTDAATKAGARLAAPFTLDSCSTAYRPAAKPPVLPHVTVCGTFTSVIEAAKIQDRLELILAHWRYLVLGGTVPDGEEPTYFCPPRGYEVVVGVWGDEDSSPTSFFEMQCL